MPDATAVTAIASVVQATSIVVLAVQLYIQRHQLRRQNHDTSLNFMVQVEGQFDSLWEDLLQLDEAVVRDVWFHEIPNDWNTDDIRALVWMARRFTYIGRVVNILENNLTETGMSSEQRGRYLALWENSLALYKNNKYMRRYYEFAKSSNIHNKAMLRIARRVFEE